MEDELRLSLLIAGSCFIIAVLAHGIWKIRKNNQAASPKRQEPRAWTEQEDTEPEELNADGHGQASPYDDLGLGEVRVVRQTGDASADDTDEMATQHATTASSQASNEAAHEEPHGQPEEDAGKPSGGDRSQQGRDAQAESDSPPPEDKLYGSVVSNPKPHMQSQKSSQVQAENPDFPEPPGFLIKESQEDDSDVHTRAPKDAEDVDSFSLDAQPAEPAADEVKQSSGLGEHAKKLVSRKRSKPSAHKRRQEPNFGDDQMRIDFDNQDKSPELQVVDDETGEKSKAPSQSAEQEVLVLNVRAKPDEPISGAALLPLLLTLGFKFGDQDIFHRHVNSNGKGPVLFSLANMFKPGNFDIDNLETFTTQGISLFMILPIEGDPHQVFNMMHNAGRKIAEEFGGQILDGRRSVLTKQGLQQYTEKIREFERQRMISRH